MLTVDENGSFKRVKIKVRLTPGRACNGGKHIIESVGHTAKNAAGKVVLVVETTGSIAHLFEEPEKNDTQHLKFWFDITERPELDEYKYCFAIIGNGNDRLYDGILNKENIYMNIEMKGRLI